MYEAKSIADEIPRLAMLFKLERRNELPMVHQQCSQSQPEPVKENHLQCCLGVKCKECPALMALEQMPDSTAEQIDAAKAYTCVAHIAGEGGDRAREGYILTVNDRMFWDRVYNNMTHGEVPQ